MLNAGKQTAAPLGSIEAVSVFRHYHEPLASDDKEFLADSECGGTFAHTKAETGRRLFEHLIATSGNRHCCHPGVTPTPDEECGLTPSLIKSPLHAKANGKIEPWGRWNRTCLRQGVGAANL
jgi:hypothetical protein